MSDAAALSVADRIAIQDLMARYGEPGRAYHTAQHLQECFAWFDAAHESMRAPGEVAIALFYHDAVYDTHARDSEEQSAALAADMLAQHCRADGDTVARVCALVLATKHDAAPLDGSR